MTTPELLIQASQLRKHFAGKPAVDGIDLEIAAGELYGLVGPDGAGKTTTLRLLVGALRPDGGEANICGFSVHTQVEQARARIGYLSQRFSLYEDLSVLENIRFFAEVRGLPAAQWKPRCMEILAFVGLADFANRRAGQLSGGMKQKLGLASALVTRPSVLLLDEPTTGVDPVTRQDFWQLLIRLLADSSHAVAVILSTPYMDEAARCHRVGFMRHGRLITQGTPGQVRKLLDGRIVELHGRPLQQMRVLAAAEPDVEDVRAFGDRLHLRVKAGQAEDVIRRLGPKLTAGGIELSAARQVPPVLEDAFLALSEDENG